MEEFRSAHAEGQVGPAGAQLGAWLEAPAVTSFCLSGSFEPEAFIQTLV